MLRGIAAMAEEKGWHIEKRINIADFVAIVPLVAVVFWWALTVETRIAVVQEQLVNYVQNQQEIKQGMQRLNDKIDRLLESQRKR